MTGQKSMEYQLPSSEEKAKYVQKKFGEIAPKYDLFNDLITFGMHRYWKKFMIRQTGISIDGMCLDLCCGTGDIASYLYEKASEGCIIGVDFSTDMLRIAQARLKKTSVPVALIQANAMKLPFSSQTFDTVTIGYGLRNVENLPGSLNEILRVLKPGGVFVSLDVGKTNLPLISLLYHLYFFHVVPLIGKLLYPGQEMFHYLPHSSINYPDQETLKRIMLHAGFKQVDIFDFVFGSSTIHVAYKA